MLDILSRPISPVEFLSRRFRLLALLAGLCWIGHYALQFGHGLATRTVLFDTGGTLVFRLDTILFFAAYVVTGLALIAFATYTAAKRVWLKRSAIAFAFVGALGGLAGLLSVANPLTRATFNPVAQITGKFILALFIAALAGAVGAWRVPDARARRAARYVLLFGLLTIPLAIGVDVLAQVIPMYLIYDGHFVFSGALLIAAARTMATQSKTVLAPATQTAAEIV